MAQGASRCPDCRSCSAYDICDYKCGACGARRPGDGGYETCCGFRMRRRVLGRYCNDCGSVEDRSM